MGVLSNADAAEVDATDAATANSAISTSAPEAWPTFDGHILDNSRIGCRCCSGRGHCLLWFTGLLPTLNRRSVAFLWRHLSIFRRFGVFLWSTTFLFLATPTPEVEATAEAGTGVGVGVGVGSFYCTCGPSNWTPCFRGLISSPAAGANTVTGVVGIVVAGTFFFTGVSATVARHLDFRVGVRGSDVLSPTLCSVGVAVMEIVVAVLVGTVIVFLCTTCGSLGSSAS